MAESNLIYLNVAQFYDKCKDLKYVIKLESYRYLQVITYALAVGIKMNDNNSSKYLYESHKDFACLPTFSSIFTQRFNIDSEVDIFPNGKRPDTTKRMFGEIYTQVYKALPTEGEFRMRRQCMDIIDKGKLVQVVTNIEMINDKEEVIAFNQSVGVYLEQGGFGGSKSSSHLIPIKSPPSRKPDASVQEKTTTEQLVLFRLLGDLNPLHIDPDYATRSGFKAPILHGLCTYGIACKHVMNTFCGGEASMIKAIKSRFSKEVIPGQTIVTNMWKDDNRVYFESQVLETGHKCITGGYVDLQTNLDSSPNCDH